MIDVDHPVIDIRSDALTCARGRVSVWISWMPAEDRQQLSPGSEWRWTVTMRSMFG